MIEPFVLSFLLFSSFGFFWCSERKRKGEKYMRRRASGTQKSHDIEKTEKIKQRKRNYFNPPTLHYNNNTFILQTTLQEENKNQGSRSHIINKKKRDLAWMLACNNLAESFVLSQHKRVIPHPPSSFHSTILFSPLLGGGEYTKLFCHQIFVFLFLPFFYHWSPCEPRITPPTLSHPFVALID
jgi:hypothetical protein